MHFRRILFLAFTLLPSAWLTASAQTNVLLATDDWSYRVVERLQRRGLLLELDPTTLPYRAGEVHAALARVDTSGLSETERRWVGLLRREFEPVRTEDGEIVLGGTMEAGLDATNNDRLDPLRYTDAGEPPLQAGSARLFPALAFRGYAERGRAVAKLGIRHSLFYDVDPDGLDFANRLYTRSEDAYLGIAGGFVSAYAGRFRNHWGRPGESALFLSSNPLSFDQISLRVGGERLSLHSVTGELDSAIDTVFTGRVGDLPPEARSRAVRRFISAHRLNWRPSRRFQVSVIESVLYSSPGAGFSLKYLNPLHFLFFEVDNSPKNDENNGLVGGLLWAYLRPFTVTGQLLLDDIDVLNAREPGSVALSGSINWAGVARNADAGFALEVVTARAYNTHQPEGRYLYGLRGFGTQFSDYVHATLYSDLFLDGVLSGLTVTPRLHALWQGPRDIRQRYPSNEEAGWLLDSPVRRTLRAAAQLHYQPDRRFWLRLDYGLNLTDGPDGVRRLRPVGLLSFGARLSSARPYRLSLR